MTLLIGADPKKPVKNRVTNTDAAFVLREVPIANSAWQKTAGRILTRRPQISDMGAQIMGPKMKPTLHLALAMYPQTYQACSRQPTDTKQHLKPKPPGSRRHIAQ